jgi:alkylhydroperoxidase family enzyme
MIPFFDERERAALDLTEALTRMPEGGVPDATYVAAPTCSTRPSLAS